MFLFLVPFLPVKHFESPLLLKGAEQVNLLTLFTRKFHAEFTRRQWLRICRGRFTKFGQFLLMTHLLKSRHLLMESGAVVFLVQWLDQLKQTAAANISRFTQTQHIIYITGEQAVLQCGPYTLLTECGPMWSRPPLNVVWVISCSESWSSVIRSLRTVNSRCEQVLSLLSFMQAPDDHDHQREMNVKNQSDQRIFSFYEIFNNLINSLYINESSPDLHRYII